MAAACDVIYLTIVAMETNKRPRGFAQLKVQMKFVICKKFHVNRINCVESRRGGPIDLPPPRLRVTIFSSRLLGLGLPPSGKTILLFD